MVLGCLVALLARPEPTYASCPPLGYDQIVKSGLPDGTPAIVAIGTAGDTTSSPVGGRHFEVEALLRGSVPREVVLTPPIDQEEVSLEPGARYVVLITATPDGALLSCKRPATIDTPEKLQTALSWAVRPVILDPTILPGPFGSANPASRAGTALAARLPILLALVGVVLAVALVLVRQRRTDCGRGAPH
jgi:hypothetical protein